jgi:hypothetical protein
MEWVDAEVIEKTLRTEASGLASALGHKMSLWAPHPSEKRLLVARCEVCAESMTIAVRKLRALPISGAATQLRCRSVRK